METQPEGSPPRRDLSTAMVFSFPGVQKRACFVGTAEQSRFGCSRNGAKHTFQSRPFFIDTELKLLGPLSPQPHCQVRLPSYTLVRDEIYIQGVYKACCSLGWASGSRQGPTTSDSSLIKTWSIIASPSQPYRSQCVKLSGCVGVCGGSVTLWTHTLQVDV